MKKRMLLSAPSTAKISVVVPSALTKHVLAKSVLQAVVSVAATEVATSVAVATVAVATGINPLHHSGPLISYPLFGSPKMTLHFNPGSAGVFFAYCLPGLISCYLYC
jgi:hypothetical protein